MRRNRNTGERVASAVSTHDGVRAGLLGAGAAWAWLFVADALGRTPFRTPLFLGRGILAVDRVTQAPAWAGVLAFTVFLCAVWVGAASAASLAVRRAARQPSLLLFAVVVLTLLEFAFFDLTMLLDREGLGPAAWWSTYPAHLAGWLAVWWYLLRRHPGAPAGLRAASGD